MATHTDIPADLGQRAAALAGESGLDLWEQEFRLIQKAAAQADRGEFASDADIERIRNKYKPAG